MILSCDTDTLIFGGPHNRALLIKGKGSTYLKYELCDILKHMKLTYKQLVKISVALGTDFNKKILGIGPKTVVKKVLDDKVSFTKRHRKVIKMYMRRIDI